MTSYITITDAETDPSAPITSELAKKWRDNPIAITEGETGAPRIVGAAMFAPSAGTVVQRNCLPFGNEVVASTGSASSNISASVFTALVACTVQFRVSCSITAIGTTDLRIFKNGTVVQTYTTSQTGATTNVTLAAGDNVGVAIRATGGGGNTATTSVSVLEIRVDTRSAVMT